MSVTHERHQRRLVQMNDKTGTGTDDTGKNIAWNSEGQEGMESYYHSCSEETQHIQEPPHKKQKTKLISYFTLVFYIQNISNICCTLNRGVVCYQRQKSLFKPDYSQVMIYVSSHVSHDTVKDGTSLIFVNLLVCRCITSLSSFSCHLDQFRLFNLPCFYLIISTQASQ